MKYTERIGEVENIYEGTPKEIMDLYNTMVPKESPKEDLKKLIDDDVNMKEKYDNMQHFNLMPSAAILGNTYKATGIAAPLKQMFNPIENISYEIAANKIGEEIIKKIRIALSKI